MHGLVTDMLLENDAFSNPLHHPQKLHSHCMKSCLNVLSIHMFPLT